jgi:hypothetical protein
MRPSRARVRRKPSARGFVGAAAHAADWEDLSSPVLRRFLTAYRGLDVGSQDESLSPEARLADQIYRLSATHCADGCPACLHRASELMGASQAAVAVSRDLLARYREWVLAPLTLRVGPDGEMPSPAVVRELIDTYGTCRLLVDPRRYDALGATLAALGFGAGRYDPTLGEVVAIADESGPGPASSV